MPSKPNDPSTVAALAAIIALAILIPITLLRAWVLLKLWQWYIPIDFMTIKISIGTCFIAGLLTHKYSKENDEDFDFKTLAQLIVAPIWLLGFAWIILQIL